MKIAFASAKLGRILADPRAMERAYGILAKKLMLRLQLLAAVPALVDVPAVPPERCHPLTGDFAGQFAVVLAGNWRLVFEADHEPLPRKPDGGLDLARVTAIIIIDIVDYH